LEEGRGINIQIMHQKFIAKIRAVCHRRRYRDSFTQTSHGNTVLIFIISQTLQYFSLFDEGKERKGMQHTLSLLYLFVECLFGRLSGE